MTRNINGSVEEMIQMFLKYGAKDALSVDEFMMFRKQAVDECMSGLIPNAEEESCDTKNTPDNNNKDVMVANHQESLRNSETNGRIIAQSRQCAESLGNNLGMQAVGKTSHTITAPPTESSRTVSCEIPPESEEDECNSFTDADFLAMMRSVED